MSKLSLLCSLLLSATLALSAFGCRLPKPVETPVPAQPKDVVEVIQIFKGRVPTSPPSTQIMVRPSADWASGLPVDPHPDKVQGVYSRGDKIFLGLRLVSKTPVTFTKYTFLNKSTGEEVEIGGLQTGLGVGVPASDLGPFEGQYFPFFDNPLWVPDEPGIYEIRAYRDDVMAASAVFEVVSTVSQNGTPPTVFTIITAPLTLDGTKPGTDIPWGSVVYHWVNGITEVYGTDNNRIFIAKDSSAAVIIGPGGGRAATRMYQVPSGARIDSQAMAGNDKATKIYMGDTLIMTIIEKTENFLY